MKTDTDANTVTHPEGQGQYPEPQPVSVETIPASSSWTKAEPDLLMEAMVATENMQQAYRRVVANQGAPGADGMTVPQLADHLKEHWPTLRERLLAGEYQPSPVRAVEIPKPKGGTRQLGIPTVSDRLIQQALLQVLAQTFDPGFSESSYGYRPKCSAQQAVSAMRVSGLHADPAQAAKTDADQGQFAAFNAACPREPQAWQGAPYSACHPRTGPRPAGVGQLLQPRRRETPAGSAGSMDTPPTV